MIIMGVIVAYLLGSIPTAVWYGKIFHGVDIRQHGSGNAGATNSLRTFGRKAGIIVLVIDFLKGFLAVLSAQFLFSDTDKYLPLMMGLTAVIGHLYPVFAQFRGGKGVATALGVIAASFPLTVIICIVVFFILVFLTKYVSLGSMIGALAFPIQVALNVWDVNPKQDPYYLAFACVLSLILVFTHRHNIQRLMNGTENKFGAKK
ncbi:glycerol-3-phosphate 1-O-acyltransferase PlsY [Emticicia sp. BO119]|uniref:glycerol-3-phosphate 1-O-acyltransferase PlsY n=1 Tax=Emticicia sp. BO119 TaxID=2757768 RepID=UPI0015EFF380|nr:glycerol-3-phosphate 1-O-acyltransferase PlsY [Emticicia sp. BO119]MBA4850204.1 glycerol-3-phosphate 1-O-acyltransferase PlsY [Emticicia sp. BO119]